MDDPSVILFDLDDTIVDFSWNVAASWDRVCAPVAAETGVEAAALRSTIDVAAKRFWSDHDRAEVGRRDLIAATAAIVAEAFDALDMRVRAELPREMSLRYREQRDAGMRLFEGAVEVLDALRAEGRRLALVTNGTSAEQRAKIDRFDLERHFDHIQIEGEFGIGKPHDAAYRHALEVMDADASSTWFVGDNLEWDVAAPQRHGMFGIWVDGRGGGLPAGTAHRPDRVVRHIGELLQRTATDAERR